MANETISLCPAPFLSTDDFPYTGGLESSRLCRRISDSATCCLPCPLTDWVYPDNYLHVANAANWVSVGSVTCCCFLLLSFAVLPVQKTSRHYLTICLVTAIGLCCLSFVVALGASPVQCYDAITPNDMRSDLSCAFSGALVVFGGFASVIWVFLRSLSVYLQICWEIVPGNKYFYASVIAGWGIPALILALSLSMSGVSYRFGNICHINHDHAMAVFWGPMLAFAGLTGVLQFITFGYCIRVYLRSFMDSGFTSEASSHLHSFHGSTKTVTARAAYRRVRKVIVLQWRGIMVVLILIVSVVYFSVVFIRLDTMTAADLENPSASLPWLECIILNGGDKSQCLGLASGLILSEPTVMAVLFLIASFGYWCALFLGRLSMISGWIELICGQFRKRRTSTSAETSQLNDPCNYEMLSSPPQRFHLAKGPGGLVATATTEAMSDMSPASRHAQLSKTERGNSVNFSHPRSLERVATRPKSMKFSDDNHALLPEKEWTSPLPQSYLNGSRSKSGGW